MIAAIEAPADPAVDAALCGRGPAAVVFQDACLVFERRPELHQPGVYR